MSREDVAKYITIIPNVPILPVKLPIKYFYQPVSFRKFLQFRRFVFSLGLPPPGGSPAPPGPVLLLFQRLEAAAERRGMREGSHNSWQGEEALTKTYWCLALMPCSHWFID